MRGSHDVMRAVGLLWLLVCVPLTGSAQEIEPLRQVVPYTGHLDRDGAPFDGVTALRFRLHVDPADEALVWQEVHRAVNVRDGRFAVRLGDGEGLADQPSIFAVAAAGAQLYLELSVGPAVAEGVEPEWTQLAGRQAIHPVPQAVWAATATDLPVARLHNPGPEPVTVDDDLAVTGGAALAADLTVAGGAAIGADLTVAGGAALAADLTVAGGAAIDADLAVEGALRAIGGATVGPEDGPHVVTSTGRSSSTIRAGSGGLTVAAAGGQTLTLGTDGQTTRLRGDLRGQGDRLRVADPLVDPDSAVNIADDLSVSGSLTVEGRVVQRTSMAAERLEIQAGFGQEFTDDGPSTSSRLCFLTRHSGSLCRVEVNGDNWRLRAGNAHCEARCIRWR